jgi:alanyl-tRNA synthetase
MKISSSTTINYPGGAISGTAKVIFYKKLPAYPNKLLVVTDSTPFHPLDYNWPDQPSDMGFMKSEETIFPIEECLIGAMHRQTDEFLLDQEIKNLKIRRDDSNWYFVVVHIIHVNLPNDNWSGLTDKIVYLEVDGKYRLALSRSHTACHLAALAINKVTAKFWKKSSEYQDSLGS